MYSLTDVKILRYHKETLERLFIATETSITEIDYSFDYNSITTTVDFFLFLEVKFLNVIHGHPGLPDTEQEKGFVASDNFLLGAPRIRQVRVKPDLGCSVHDIFAKEFSHCYDRYKFQNADIHDSYKGWVLLLLFPILKLFDLFLFIAFS